MNTLKRFRIAFIILSVLEVVLGVVLILNPMTSAITLSYLFGALVLIWGLAKVIGYFTKDDFGVPYGLDLAGGLLNLLMGVLASRLMLKSVSRQSWARNPALYGGKN